MKKKIIFLLVFVVTISAFFLKPEKANAASCIKKGGVVACTGIFSTDSSKPIQCIVAGTYYCCATQADCTSQQNQGNGTACQPGEGGQDQPCCGGQGGSCSNSSLTCTYSTTPSGGNKVGYYCLTAAEIQKGVNPTSSPVLCGTNNTGIQTAIGCIPILGPDGQTDFLSFILKWAVGVGGGIAFLLILYGGFMVMTSAGNPERLKAGQELLTSAISGLILLIFSVFILKFIGIDILGLGQFGFGK